MIGFCLAVKNPYGIIEQMIESKVGCDMFRISVQVELEMAMNTTSPNYCRSKGEQIAFNVDGTGYDDSNTYASYVYSRPSA